MGIGWTFYAHTDHMIGKTFLRDCVAEKGFFPTICIGRYCRTMLAYY